MCMYVYILYKHLHLITVIDGDQSKITLKDEENLSVKLEEKSCSNPLAGLANTINSITNGINNEDSAAIPASVSVSANSKHVPPKAMVKPQVLTHVIEGFVIQEGTSLIFDIDVIALLIDIVILLYIYIIDMYMNISASEPFAVNRTSLNNTVNQEAGNILNRSTNSSSERDSHEEPPSKT